MKSTNMFKYLLLTICMIYSYSMDAQRYSTAAGVKIGSDYGLTVQQKVSKKMTVQGLYYGGFTNNNIHANVMAQRHFSVFSNRTNIFLGGGLGSHWNYDTEIQQFQDQSFVIPFGFGIETTLGRLNISADVMKHLPLSEVNTGSGNRVASVSLRYVIVKDKRAKKLVNRIGDKFSGLNKKKGQKPKGKKKKF